MKSRQEGNLELPAQDEARKGYNKRHKNFDEKQVPTLTGGPQPPALVQVVEYVKF